MRSTTPPARMAGRDWARSARCSIKRMPDFDPRNYGYKKLSDLVADMKSIESRRLESPTARPSWSGGGRPRGRTDRPPKTATTPARWKSAVAMLPPRRDAGKTMAAKPKARKRKAIAFIAADTDGGQGRARPAGRALRRRGAGQGRCHRRPRRRRLHAADAAPLHEHRQADLRHEPRLGRLPDERVHERRAARAASTPPITHRHPSAGHARHRRATARAHAPTPSTRSRCCASPTRPPSCASPSTARCGWRS